MPWTLFIWHKVSCKIVGLSFTCLDRTSSTLGPCLHESIQRRNFSHQSLAKFVQLLPSYFIKGIHDEFYAFGYFSQAILMFVSLVCCNYFLKEILNGFYCLWILIHATSCVLGSQYLNTENHFLKPNMKNFLPDVFWILSYNFVLITVFYTRNF